MVAEAPLLLALDSSTAVASLALYDGERVLAESTWLAGREHSTQLLQEVDRALARLRRQPGDLTGLVVARGPGSFTGVRVALSVAKGMAAGLGVPIWGVSALDVLARGAALAPDPVWAALEAGRGRLAVARYEAGRCVWAPRNASVEDFAALVRAPAVVVGDVPPLARHLFEERGVRVASPAGSLRRAGYLAELGWLAAQAGDPGDAAGLDALYLGRPRGASSPGAPSW